MNGFVFYVEVGFKIFLKEQKLGGNACKKKTSFQVKTGPVKTKESRQDDGALLSGLQLSALATLVHLHIRK